jgi:predicted RNase H-like HicB family nuclease
VDVPSPERGETTEYIILTFMVQVEGDYQVSKCLELGTASLGRSTDDALENLMDATRVYLDTLDDLGECRQLLEEKRVTVYSCEPTELETRRAELAADGTLVPQVMALGPACLWTGPG